MLTSLYSHKNREDGFTLIELLVVIIIIGILAAIAIPLFLDQRKLAVDASVKADVRNTVANIQTWQANTEANRTKAIANTGEFTNATNNGKVAQSPGNNIGISIDSTGAATVCGYNSGGKTYLNGTSAAYVFNPATGQFTTGACATGSTTGGTAPGSIASGTAVYTESFSGTSTPTGYTKNANCTWNGGPQPASTTQYGGLYGAPSNVRVQEVYYCVNSYASITTSSVTLAPGTYKFQGAFTAGSDYGNGSVCGMQVNGTGASAANTTWSCGKYDFTQRSVTFTVPSSGSYTVTFYGTLTGYTYVNAELANVSIVAA